MAIIRVATQIMIITIVKLTPVIRRSKPIATPSQHPKMDMALDIKRLAIRGKSLFSHSQRRHNPIAHLSSHDRSSDGIVVPAVSITITSKFSSHIKTPTGYCIIHSQAIFLPALRSEVVHE